MTSDSGRGALAELSDGMAAAVERAARSTVTVNARRRLPASGVVWAEGVILTSDHVIEREEDIKIGLPDGTELPAQIAGRDPGSDLAVLRVSGASLIPAERVAAGTSKVGHMVLAVGRPSADGPMASLGVISTIGGPWRTRRGGQVDGYIRSDVTFYPGFSGGPLVDLLGRVAGINSSRLGRGAGLTVPSSAAEKVAAALLSGGRIKRGYLGLGSQPVRLPEALAAKLGGQETGLLIVTVESGTPADQGGLLIGDIIVKMGGSAVRDTDDLQAHLGPDSVGQATPVTVLRGGEPRELTVTVGERTK
jgi:S1-C subfamily serine protease